MRWLLLLLLMLNAFYYIWHQQEAPPRPKEIMPLAMQRNQGQDIRLLSESRPSGQAEARECLYLGGLPADDQVRAIEQRLTSLDVQSSFHAQTVGASSVYWLKVLPESRRLIGADLLAQLAQDFPQIKNQIMLCEGIASAI